jgi:hypothetical protein
MGTSARVDLKGRSLNEKNELEGGVQYSCDGLSCSPSIGRQSASGGQRWSNINSERNFNSPISTVTASRRVLLVFGPTPFKRPSGPGRVSTPRLNMARALDISRSHGFTGTGAIKSPARCIITKEVSHLGVSVLSAIFVSMSPRHGGSHTLDVMALHKRFNQP